MKGRLFRFFKSLSFQKKIFAVCLLASLVPVIILGCFSYHQIRQLLIEREKVALKDTLQRESVDLHARLNECENIMQHIVFNENVRSAFSRDYDNNYDMYIAYRDTLIPLVTSLKTLHSDIKNIIVYTDTPIYPRADVLLPLALIENQPWYKEACQNSKTLWIVSAEDQSLGLIRKINNVAESRTAIVKIELDYASFFHSLSTLYDQPYGILLVDDQKMPIYQFQTNRQLTEILLSTTSTRQFLDQQGNTHIVEVSPQFFDAWSLYIHRPMQLILEPTHLLAVIILAIVVICLFGVALLSSFLSTTIVRPLQDLIVDMQQAERGNYKSTTSYDSADEIGRLVNIFQELMKEIDHLINEKLNAKILQQKLEMRALQAQINPHFLYNSLSLINSRAILSGQEEISQMARFMSTFYRTTLNKGKHITTVQDELDNVYAYINIQQLMHAHSFEASYNIAPDILSLSTLNLLLQPLVENAILHGLDQRTNGGRGQLRIVGYKTSNALILQVKDNGPGIPPEKLCTILTDSSNGYGVQNVHSRIQLFYGSEYGLTYESNETTGTTATLTLPLS